MLVVKREARVCLWCCYVFPMGDGVNFEMLVNGEDCVGYCFGLI